MVWQNCETRLNHGLVINPNDAVPILATHKCEEMMKVAVRFNQQNLPATSQSLLFSKLFLRSSLTRWDAGRAAASSPTAA